MGVPANASEASAAKRSEPMLDADELLARRTRAGLDDLRLLDLAPVVIVGCHDPATGEQAFEPSDARTVGAASGRHLRGNLVGNFVAVGPVGPDRSGWPAPCPADGVEAFGDAAALVQELAAALVVGDTLHRRSRIADGTDNERSRHGVGFTSAARGPALI